MELKSIWDGWEKQCYDALFDFAGGTCARGYLTNDGKQDETARSPKIAATYRRVAAYLRERYAIPDWNKPTLRYPNTYDRKWHDHMTIIYANNDLRLTPEDFRRIDRETQIAEGMAAVEKLVDSALENAPASI